MRASLVVACVTVAAIAIGSAARAQGQAAPELPRVFEVASVKASDPNPSSPIGAIPMILPQPGGRLRATNVPLRLLVRVAYELQDFQIVGGPSWQMSNKFDITAKAEDGSATAMTDLLPMLRTLLADRFKLKAHTETREMPVSALVIARDDKKLGPDLKPSTANCPDPQAQAQQRAEALAKGGPAALASLIPKPGETIPCSIAPAMSPGGFGMRANGQPMLVLTQLLTQATGRMVHDKTGLTGLYDFELKFDPEILLRLASQVGINLPPGMTSNLPQSDSPSLFTALQEQLGLKLASERGPVNVLVIESAELPTPD